jgi:hypothetical protein
MIEVIEVFIRRPKSYDPATTREIVLNTVIHPNHNVKPNRNDQGAKRMEPLSLARDNKRENMHIVDNVSCSKHQAIPHNP